MPTARGARSGGFSAFERFQRPSGPAQNGAAQNGSPGSPGSPGPAAPVPGRPAPPARELSVAEVQRLLEDLRAAVVGLAFQKALDSVRSKDWGALKKRAGVAKLLSYAWKAPLKASGLAIDAYSFPRVLAAVRTHAKQPGIKTLAEEVEKLLKFFPGALFGSNAGKMKGSANNAALKEASSSRGAFSKMSNGGAEKRAEPAPAPAPAPAAPSHRPATSLRGRPMGLGEAKDILKRLKEEILKKEFQDGLADLSRGSVPDVQKAYSHFVCKQWAEAMKFYEFPVSPDGFREMVDGIQRCAYNRHVEMLAHEVEEKLRVPKGSFFGVAPPEGDEGEEEEPAGGAEQSGRSDDILILLRHNQLGTELAVPVPAGATFWDVKVEAARLLGCGDIKTKGRLVRKSPGGTFVSYKDSDQLGAVREAIVLGAELTPLPGAKQEAAPRAARLGAAPSFRLRFEDMTPRVPQLSQKPPQQEWRMPELTREQASQLLQELHAGYADADFQRRLKKFHADLGTTTQFSKERQRLALTVQSLVLPKYGFRGSIDGVLDMQTALGPFVMKDTGMQRIASECDDLLLANARVKKKPKAETADTPQAGANKVKAQPEPEEPPKAPATDPEPEPPSRLEPQKPLVPAVEVYFVVRHAHNRTDEEVWLKAMSTATFLQVKHVLAAKLGRDEVRTKGRLVYRAEGGAGVWTDFPDEEELGRQRKVLHIMGVSMPSRESKLLLRHALKQDCGQVELNIWTHWKFREVKEALAEKVGRPEIAKLAKFVFKPNSTNAQGAWAAFKDDEQVGGSRSELFVMGDFDLAPTAEAKAKEEAEKAAPAAEPQKAEEKAEEKAVDQAALAKRAAEEMEMKRSEDAKRKVKDRKDKKVKEVVQEYERKEREEAERKAKEEAERKAAETRRKEEAERKAREEAERLEREEAQRKEKEDAERKAKEEAERREKEETERKAKEEAERREKEEAERKAKEEEERREREEADRKAREEAEQREREEAAGKATEERERREREEAERSSAEQLERRAKEEAERRAKEEAERTAAERKAKEEVERRAAAAKEEAERKAREEADRRRKEEEAERKAKAEEAERKVKEETERKAKEEAERKAKEEGERKAKEEADRRAKEEAEKAKEAERKAQEKAKQEAERKAKEVEAAERRVDQWRKAKEEAEQKAKAAAMKVAAPPPRPSQKEIVAAMKPPALQPVERTDDSTLWLVVGGEEKGGILVRKGESYDSKPFPFRLQTGARVEEMEVVGNRLHYKRLYGDGPDFGWVNIKLNEKVLIEPYELDDF